MCTWKARLWALAGNSRTMLVGYAAQVLWLLEEANVVDWSSLIGYEKAGRIVAVMGIAMIVLRIVTRNPVNFRAQKAEDDK